MKTLLSSGRVVEKNPKYIHRKCFVMFNQFYLTQYCFYSYFKFKLFFDPICKEIQKHCYDIMCSIYYSTKDKYSFKYLNYLRDIYAFLTASAAGSLSYPPLSVCVCACAYVCVWFYCISDTLQTPPLFKPPY